MADEPKLGGDKQGNNDVDAAEALRLQREELMQGLMDKAEAQKSAANNDPTISTVAGLRPEEMGVQSEGNMPTGSAASPVNQQDRMVQADDDLQKSTDDPYAANSPAAQKAQYDAATAMGNDAAGKFGGSGAVGARAQMTAAQQQEEDDRRLARFATTASLTYAALQKSFSTLNQEAQELITQSNEQLESLDDTYEQIQQATWKAGQDFVLEQQKLQALNEQLNAARLDGNDTLAAELEQQVQQQQVLVDMKQALYEAQDDMLKDIDTMRTDLKEQTAALEVTMGDLKQQLANASSPEERLKIEKKMEAAKDQVEGLEQKIQESMDRAQATQDISNKMSEYAADGKLDYNEIQNLKQMVNNDSELASLVTKAGMAGSAAGMTVTDSTGETVSQENADEFWTNELQVESQYLDASENTVAISGYNTAYDVFVYEDEATGQYYTMNPDSMNMGGPLVRNDITDAETLEQIQSQLASGIALGNEQTLAAEESLHAQHAKDMVTYASATPELDKVAENSMEVLAAKTALQSSDAALASTTSNTVTIEGAVAYQKPDGELYLMMTDGQEFLVKDLTLVLDEATGQTEGEKLTAEINAQLAAGKTLGNNETMLAQSKVKQAELSLEAVRQEQVKAAASQIGAGGADALTAATTQTGDADTTKTTGEVNDALKLDTPEHNLDDYANAKAETESRLAEIASTGGVLTAEEVEKMAQLPGMSEAKIQELAADNGVQIEDTARVASDVTVAPSVADKVVPIFPGGTPIMVAQNIAPAQSQPDSNGIINGGGSYGSYADSPDFTQYGPEGVATKQTPIPDNVVPLRSDMQNAVAGLTQDQTAPGAGGLTAEQAQAMEAQKQQELAAQQNLEQQQKILMEQDAMNKGPATQTGGGGQVA